MAGFNDIQALMQQAAGGGGGPPPQGSPMPPGAPPAAGPGPEGGDMQSQAVQIMQAAWAAGKQGVPFEMFMQKLMQAGGGGGQPMPGGPQ